MNKKEIYSVAIAIMVVLAACSSEENLPKIEPEVKPETGRTISISATLTNENHNTQAAISNDDPITRVTLTRNKTEGKIEVRWEVGDDIEFAFVQGKKVEIDYANVKSISNEGNTAHFEIPIPDGLTGQFTLYGVYGYGKMSSIGGGRVQMQPIITLPTNLHHATSLNGATESVESREDMVVYFEQTMDANDTNAEVTFNHLGSFFCITVKNNSTADLTDLNEVKLTGVNNPNNQSWAYNGGGNFNLITKEFVGVSHTNEIALKTTSTTLEAGESLTYWSWNPPMGKTWPQLKLNMKWAEINSYAATKTPTSGTKIPAVGNNYYFYAVWDGAELRFTNEAGVQ